MHGRMRTRAAAGVIAAALLGAVAFAAPLWRGRRSQLRRPGHVPQHARSLRRDPDGLDADNDGIGCEDPSVFPAPADPAPAPTGAG